MSCIDTLYKKKVIRITMSKLLKTAEAAEYLGIAKSYLLKLMMKKEIPYFKPHGKLCYFDPDDLAHWQRRYRIASNEELEQIAQNSLLKTVIV